MAIKTILSEDKLPTRWYNIVPDMPEGSLSPPLNPGTGKPIGPEDLSAIFPMSLIGQEVSAEQYIDIPEEVYEIYKLWRPTPLIRALQLEKALDTPAKIYFKYEGVSPAGSHKPNTAVPQAYYNKEAGIKRIATETGAGQWGSAMALATQMFGMECTVYMVKVSFNQKPYRRSMMEVWGAEVLASPTDRTQSGQKILAEDPESLGSLGIAISEAVEDAATHDDVNYSLGSVLNHVLLHQTIIGEEAQLQMEMAGDYPDTVIGCIGGGSNYAGLCFPFMRDRLAGGKDIQFLAAEPTACPTVTKGSYTYDFGDTLQSTPLMMMHTLGHDFVPPGIHAGGLRYHAMAPLISALVDSGNMDAVAYTQNQIFEAAILFARTEGIIPAPEASHAIKAAIDKAVEAREAGEEKTILFNLSGHGYFDMSAYDQYLSGKLEDYAYPEEKIRESMEKIPKLG
ncbi:tryptophan synthase beta chain [bacterium BMS3Abin01]|nr:tryptophan synthase beta chain [bacterium BMS3Abin01]HDZ60051.1 TrpB-like pyridoxal phosphate-dependent enzyme [Actinomycetota bacterium]